MSRSGETEDLRTRPNASAAERRAALEALYQAHDAQFPTVAALAEVRFTSLKRSAFDVAEAWREADRQIEAAKRARARRPLGRAAGLAAFWDTAPSHTDRRILYFEAPKLSGGSQNWAPLVERFGESNAVCIVQLERGCGVFNGFASLATLAARQIFAAPRWRAWVWRPPRQLQFYSYVPWALHGGADEMFHARALDWSKGRFVEDEDRRRHFANVPLVLACLDPKPTGPHLLMPLD